MMETYVAPWEVKFAAEEAGEFEGYASVFGIVDAHGDLIIPGAFTTTLAQHKAAGTMPAMYANHGPALGGDPLPVGVWSSVEEDGKGLRVKGRISALDTDHGRRIRSLVRDGALQGLSIGYNPAPNGAVYGRKPGDPRRTLKSILLKEVSLVTEPSNRFARVESIKSRLSAGDPPTLREFEEMLRERLLLSRSQAAALAAGGYKSLIARESADGEANKPEDTLAKVRAVLRSIHP